MSSTDIKRFSDQFRQIKQSIEQKLLESTAKLNQAHTSFQTAAQNTDAYVDAVNSYATELNSLAAELGTNGGPPLDGTFSEPTAVPSTNTAPTGVDAMIQSQEQNLHRRHPSNQ